MQGYHCARRKLLVAYGCPRFLCQLRGHLFVAVGIPGVLSNLLHDFFFGFSLCGEVTIYTHVSTA